MDRSSVIRASRIIDAALADARREGYQSALVIVEREIYSAENMDEFLHNFRRLVDHDQA